MSQTFCTSCGSALADGAAFCGTCGTPVEAAGSAPPPPAPTTPPVTDAPVYAAPPPPPPAETYAAPPPPPADIYAAPPPEPPPVYAAPPPEPPPVYAAPPPPPPVYAAPPEPAPAYAPPPAAPAYAPPAAPAYAPPAAPAYAPPPQAAAAAPLDPEYEQKARAYVGQNADYFLGKWRQIGATGKDNSWNWAAFFLSAFWLAYRKMIAPAIGTLVVLMVLQLVGMTSIGLRSVTGALQLGVCAFIGWRGNAMYRAQADQAIAKAATIAPDTNGQSAWLQTQGGVNIGAALGLLGGYVVIWFLVVFLLAKQMGLGRSSYSSSSYTPTSSSSSTSATTSYAPASSDRSSISTAYLQGSNWSVACGNSSSPYIMLNANGYFTSSAGSGVWLLTGSLLQLSYSGGGQRPEAMTLTYQGPNQFTFTEGSRAGTLNRC